MTSAQNIQPWSYIFWKRNTQGIFWWPQHHLITHISHSGVGTTPISPQNRRNFYPSQRPNLADMSFSTKMSICWLRNSSYAFMIKYFLKEELLGHLLMATALPHHSYFSFWGRRNSHFTPKPQNFLPLSEAYSEVENSAVLGWNESCADPRMKNMRDEVVLWPSKDALSVPLPENIWSWLHSFSFWVRKLTFSWKSLYQPNLASGRGRNFCGFGVKWELRRPQNEKYEWWGNAVAIKRCPQCSSFRKYMIMTAYFEQMCFT